MTNELIRKTISLPQKAWDKLDEHATKDLRSVNNLLNVIVVRWLTENDSGQFE